MTIIANNNAAAELGLKAAAAWDRSQSNGDAGDALATCALYYAAETMTFTATVERKGSGVPETIDYDLKALATPLWNADGSKDTKAMAARTLAVASRVFGITELDNAIKQRITRSLVRALYLNDALTGRDDYSECVVMKGNKLVVPYGLVHAAPAIDAEDNEKTVYDAMKDKSVTLDGRNGNSLAELSKRAKPATEKRAAGEATDKGASLMASIKFVQAIMLQNTSDEGECDVALSEELRRSLYELQTTIASYFTVDPIEVQERKAA